VDRKLVNAKSKLEKLEKPRDRDRDREGGGGGGRPASIIQIELRRWAMEISLRYRGAYGRQEELWLDIVYCILHVGDGGWKMAQPLCKPKMAALDMIMIQFR